MCKIVMPYQFNLYEYDTTLTNHNNYDNHTYGVQQKQLYGPFT